MLFEITALSAFEFPFLVAEEGVDSGDFRGEPFADGFKFFYADCAGGDFALELGETRVAACLCLFDFCCVPTNLFREEGVLGFR